MCRDFPLALSDKPGILKIYGGYSAASLIPNWAGTPKSYQSLVPVSTLDSIVSNPTGKPLIWMDVEGAEYRVLAGAKNFLKALPTIFTEICINEHSPNAESTNFEGTFRLLIDELSYEVFSPTGEKIEKTEIEKLVLERRSHLPFHNFLFVHPQNKQLSRIF